MPDWGEIEWTLAEYSGASVGARLPLKSSNSILLSEW